jgi:diazepam-binding inhibitor (GABA receptor modulating acyl-CoA-binding protein)
MSLEEKFETAKQKVLTLSEKPGNEIMLGLYGLNKQATIGDINIGSPKMFDFIAAAKYNAWKNKLGMTKEDAMKQYIELVDSLF